MGRAAPVLLAALGWLCLLLAVDASNQKGASISVRARWQGTPYLLEAAEFLVGWAAAAVALGSTAFCHAYFQESDLHPT
jgi:hypothetical protein